MVGNAGEVISKAGIGLNNSGGAGHAIGMVRMTMKIAAEKLLSLIKRRQKHGVFLFINHHHKSIAVMLKFYEKTMGVMAAFVKRSDPQHSLMTMPIGSYTPQMTRHINHFTDKIQPLMQATFHCFG